MFSIDEMVEILHIAKQNANIYDISFDVKEISYLLAKSDQIILKSEDTFDFDLNVNKCPLNLLIRSYWELQLEKEL